MKKFFLISTLALSMIIFANSLLGINIGKKLIGINIEDYKKFLINNIPLDRLYRINNITYFLVDEMEQKKIEDMKISYKIKELPVMSYNSSKKSTEKFDYNFDYNGPYHDYYETKKFLEELSKKYPENAEVSSIGKSVEGREIMLIKISDGVGKIRNYKSKLPNNSDKIIDDLDTEELEPQKKKNILILGCHHAREWISVEVPLLFASYLLENLENENIKKMISDANIYIIPLVNPDGLEFSIHKYRYWRKNRKYNGDFVWGVDLNRNYAYMWGIDDMGSSPSPKSEVYRGVAPFSEPETEAVRKFVSENPPDGSISYHNFSQMILFPWGYKYEKPENFEEIEEIASEMSKRIFAVNGRNYTFGGAESLYLVNGDTDDWLYGEYGTIAFTIELPPTNSFTGGFFTSKEEINLSFNENLPALLYFISRINE